MEESNPHICFISQQVYCYLTDGDYEGGGGAERQQYLIGTALRDQDFEVSYITGDYGGFGEEVINSCTVKRSIPMNVGYRGAHRKFSALFSAMRNMDADVYYVRSSLVLNILVTIAAKLLNKPLLYVVASDQSVEPDRLDDLEDGLFSNLFLKQWTQPVIKRLYFQSVAAADQVVTLTNHQRDVLMKEHDTRATVVPVGYDLPPESNVLDPAEREYFFWAGRLSSNNNPEQFLEAAAQVPNVEFVMAGPESSDQELSERVIQSAETLNNVTYVGYVAPTDVHEYFQRAKGFVQTTGTTAGFGNTTLEAWRFATPVISLHSNFDGMIEERDLGLYANGSVDLLAEHIASLSENPESVVNYGWNGRKHLEEQFSLDRIADSYAEIVTDIVE